MAVAMKLCHHSGVCIRLFVTSWRSVETDGWIDLVFGMEAPLTSPTFCYKEIQVSTEIRVLPLTLFPKLQS